MYLPKKVIHLLIATMILVTLACKTIMGPSSTTEKHEEGLDVSLSVSTEPSIAGQATIYPQPEGGVYMASFSQYPQIQVNLPSTFSGGYTLPVDLDKVVGISLFNLSSQQQALLAQNGFVVAMPMPDKWREFYQIYESLRYMEDQPVFVTTDAVFHVYHLIFDKMLRDLEQQFLIQNLQALTQTMLQASLSQYQALVGSNLEEQARRNLAYFAVASQLLGLPDAIPSEVMDLVSLELTNINEHAGPMKSPIWDRPDLPEEEKLIEDYSQYLPRGHYTRSEALKRYFQTMIWYGRLTYRARDSFETQRALLLVQAMRSANAANGVPAVQLWERIYEPTSFIVGKSDDLSIHEYAGLSDFVFGVSSDPHIFADNAKLSQFIGTVRQLPPPQINSMWVWVWEDRNEAIQGFRLMGQRYTLDEYVFGQLMWRNVGETGGERQLPKGLDFLAALGSQEALTILEQMGETQYANYTTQMEKVRREVSSLQIDSWTQNVYWTWLYALQPLFSPKGSQFPAFMQTQAWTRKGLNAALGSFTELKHDTLLYAKQVMAEMGGGEPEEIPHGYVEPDPEAYARLLALAQMTLDGLDRRGLLDANTRGNLENLIDLLNFLKRVSERELAGQPLDENDYWRIQLFGGELEALTLAAADKDSSDSTDLFDQKAALVIDTATGINKVLEQAVGAPTMIYVILPDQPWRVGAGAVFTYYEFEVEFNSRMTDEQWRAMLEGGGAPPLPSWMSSFMAP